MASKTNILMDIEAFTLLSPLEPNDSLRMYCRNQDGCTLELLINFVNKNQHKFSLNEKVLFLFHVNRNMDIKEVSETFGYSREYTRIILTSLWRKVFRIYRDSLK